MIPTGQKSKSLNQSESQKAKIQKLAEMCSFSKVSGENVFLPILADSRIQQL